MSEQEDRSAKVPSPAEKAEPEAVLASLTPEQQAAVRLLVRRELGAVEAGRRELNAGRVLR